MQREAYVSKAPPNLSSLLHLVSVHLVEVFSTASQILNPMLFEKNEQTNNQNLTEACLGAYSYGEC